MQSRFDRLTPVTGEYRIKRRSIVVTMDVTSLDKIGGLLLCRGEKENLYWRYTARECVTDYKIAVHTLITIGYDIRGFVVDGKPGVIRMLQKDYPGIPCQYCQFHQMQTIRQYIPRRAKSEAARSLRALAMQLTDHRHAEFKTALHAWHDIHRGFLDERTDYVDTDGKRRSRFTHERLRSAYNSLKRNLPYLYTHQEYPERNIPNTTNACDGFFSHLKERLRRHRGLSPKRKKKMTDYLLENWYD
jgi:hypothetical protein